MLTKDRHLAAVVAGNASGAWVSSPVPDAAWRALAGCRERAKEECQLYAVDDAVVWAAPAK